MDDKENVRHEAANLQPHKKPTPPDPLDNRAWQHNVDAQLLATRHALANLLEAECQRRRHAANLIQAHAKTRARQRATRLAPPFIIASVDALHASLPIVPSRAPASTLCAAVRGQLVRWRVARFLLQRSAAVRLQARVRGARAREATRLPLSLQRRVGVLERSLAEERLARRTQENALRALWADVMQMKADFGRLAQPAVRFDPAARPETPSPSMF